MAKIKLTKIMVWPTRTLKLGDFQSAKLSAGVEIELDKPIEIAEVPDEEAITKAFSEASRLIKEEFTRQYAPYKKQIEENVQAGL